MSTVSQHLPPASELVPHDAPMLMIDEVISYQADAIKTRTVLSESSLFFQPGRGIPSYVTFEIMAQSISAYDGASRLENGEPPAIGFLLGCRKFETFCEWLQPGDTVETQAIPLVSEGELRSFDCRVQTLSGSDIAFGNINVFRPNDPEAFLLQVAK